MWTTWRAHRTPFRLAAGALALALASTTLTGSATSPRFYDDDPIWIERDTEDASHVRPDDVDLVVDLTVNLFGRPGDPAHGVRARNVNTVDEVPDSSWFTNRAGLHALTAEDVARGPDRSQGPAPGAWTVMAAKSDGITPGFTVRDARGDTWFVKFDPPGHRGMATGTEVTVTKLMWALGYHVPENHIARLDPSTLVVAEKAQLRTPNGRRRPMRRSDIDDLLARADREPDGGYRVVASRALEGKPLGGIRFYGTRPDDPNDVVPHEHRRELRGYGVFAAWLNHVDAKAINALDTLVTANGRSVVRHHLIDFGSTLGSGAVHAREPWEGYEYMVQVGDVLKGIRSLGFYLLPWRTVKFYESPAIGRLPLDNTTFDPEAWWPRVPNAAFLRARADDKFWAAIRVMAISDDMIGAAVDEGRFTDEAAAAFLKKALIERRDAIGRRYLTAINPVVGPELDGAGTLTFRNAAVDAGFAEAPGGYRVVWSSFDNATDTATRLAESDAAGPRLAAPEAVLRAAPSFVKVQVSAAGDVPASWREPVDVYFRRMPGGWVLVGLERMPEAARATS